MGNLVSAPFLLGLLAGSFLKLSEFQTTCIPQQSIKLFSLLMPRINEKNQQKLMGKHVISIGFPLDFLQNSLFFSQRTIERWIRRTEVGGVLFQLGGGGQPLRSGGCMPQKTWAGWETTGKPNKLNDYDDV